MAGAKGLLGTLRVRLTAETEDFRRGLNGARQQLSSFDKGLGKFKLTAAGVVAAVGAVGAAIFSLVNKAADAGAAISDMAARTGLSIRTLQELTYAGDQLGVSIDSIQKASDALVRRIPQLESGTGDAAEAWARLGVRLRDGSGELRGMSDLLPETFRALSAVENQTERNALATQIFGRSAMDLAPLLAAGTGEVDRLTQRAHDLGLVLSNEVVNTLAETEDALSEFRMKTAAVTNEIGAAFAPAITHVLIPALTWLMDLIRDIVRGWQAVGASVALVIGAKEALAEALRMNFTSAREILQRYQQAWRETIKEIFEVTEGAAQRPPTLPVPDPEETREEGKRAAFVYFDGLQEEWERMRNEIAMRQLDVFGGEDSETLRYDIEARHALRLLDIESKRIEAMAEAGELEGQALENARAELEIRRQIVTQRKNELTAIAKAERLMGIYKDLGSSIGAAFGAAMPSNPGSDIGRNVGRIAAEEFKNIGAMFGGTMGSMILPGAGSIVGGLLGNVVGDLFGKDEPREVKQLRALEAIQQNTREQIAAVEQQTDQLLNPTSQFLNLPATFSVPHYSPGFGSGNTYHVTVTVNNPAQEIDVVAAVSRALGDSTRNSPRGLGRLN